MASLPNSFAMTRKREAISSSASSQETRCQTASPGVPAPVPEHRFLPPISGPFGAIRRKGCKTRSGEYTRSRYFATFAHRNPRVTGCSGSPWIMVARPSSTVINTPHASGQSWGHAAFTTCFMLVRLYVGLLCGRHPVPGINRHGAPKEAGGFHPVPASSFALLSRCHYADSTRHHHG